MRGRRIHAVAGSLLALLGCSTTQSITDASIAAPDAPCNGQPVSSGGILATPCSNEGATACGIAAQCEDYSLGPREVTCRCSQGIWDCDKCPDCPRDFLRYPAGANPCGSLCRVCQGGSVMRCDGVTVPVTGCYCGCGHGNVCIELDGGTYRNACHPDAGPDVIDAPSD